MYPFLLGIKRAFAYARVSTEHQSGLSIEGQLRVCKQFGEMFGVEVVAEFSDKESGKNDEREQFDVMMERLKRGEADAVLCEKYDRFSRSGASGEVLIQKIEKELGVKVIAAAELIDTTTPLGKAMRGIKMIFSNMEREEIVTRTTKRMKDIATHGFWMGGRPPLGYKVATSPDSDGRSRKRLEIDESTAPLVRQIFQMYATGKSQREIVQWLNVQGFKSSKGNAFTGSSLSDLLRNEKYIGIYTYAVGTKQTKHAERTNAVRVPGAIPPIIPEDLWKQTRKRYIAHGGYRHHYFLAGLIFCSVCGKPMHGHGGKPPSYRCRAHMPGLSITKQKAEAQVWRYIEIEILGNMDAEDFEIMADALHRRASEMDAKLGEKIKELQVRLDKLGVEERRLTEAIKAGATLEPILAEAQRLKVEKEEVWVVLNRMKLMETKKYVTAEELRAGWDVMREQFKSGSDDQREAILRSTIDRVVVYPDFLHITPQ